MTASLTSTSESTPVTPLEFALAYASRGWRVFPLFPVSATGGCSCGSPACKGKHPCISDWPTAASTDTAQINVWWNPTVPVAATRGIGIVAGSTSANLLVMDVDPRNGGSETLNALLQKYGPLPPTFTIETGGGGTHFYFSYPEGISFVTSSKLGKGIDIKADSKTHKGGGHFIVAPPSMHLLGEPYRFAAGTLLNTPLTPAPAWLLHVLQEQQKKLPSNGLPEVIPVGETHDTIRSYLGRLRYAGLLKQEALEKAQEVNRTICERELPHEELIALVDHVYKQERTLFTCDDLGNMHYFVYHNKAIVRYCKDSGQWYQWLNTHWQEFNNIQHLARRSIEKLAESAQRISDPDARAAVIKWAQKSRFERHIGALSRLACTAEELWIERNKLDADPLLLNVNNGIVDLATGKLHPHDKHKYCTNICPVNYNPNAVSPMWQQFVQEANEDPEQAQFIQLAAGYSLTGLTDEEVIFLIHGPAGSGKTTFIEAMRGVLGTYQRSVNPDIFFVNPHSPASAATPSVAKLAGVRVVVSAELPRGKTLSPWAVKALTGGDTVAARHLYKEEFEFTPIFKLWMTMNELPRFHYKDTGIQRRFLPIPFMHVPTQPNPEMKRLFRTNVEQQEAILAWAVQGAMRWLSGTRLKASLPKRLRDDKEAHLQHINPVRRWLDTHYRTHTPGEARTVKTEHLLGSLQRYCLRLGMRLTDLGVTTPLALAKLLRTFGYEMDTKNRWNLVPLDAAVIDAALTKEDIKDLSNT